MDVFSEWSLFNTLELAGTMTSTIGRYIHLQWRISNMGGRHPWGKDVVVLISWKMLSLVFNVPDKVWLSNLIMIPIQDRVSQSTQHPHQVTDRKPDTE